LERGLPRRDYKKVYECASTSVNLDGAYAEKQKNNFSATANFFTIVVLIFSRHFF
jgi:hypothetical protein